MVAKNIGSNTRKDNLLDLILVNTIDGNLLEISVDLLEGYSSNSNRSKAVEFIATKITSNID